MTLRTNTFEGQSDTTVLSAANSGGGSGDAFDDVTGTALTFSSTQAYNGTLSMRAVTGAAVSARWQGMNVATLRGSCYFYMDASQSGTREFVQVRTGAGTNVASLAIDASNQVAAINVTTLISGSTSSALSINNWYRIDWIITVGAASTGRIQYRVCSVDTADNNTVVSSYDSGATLDLGTTNLGRVYYGPAADSIISGNWYYDSVRVDDAGSGFMDGLYVATSITESFTDNLALIEATDGTPPFTIAQDSGTATTPEELDDGDVSGTGRWLVAKHATDTLVYTITDDAAVESDPVNVPPISPANIVVMHPNGTLTGWV